MAAPKNPKPYKSEKLWRDALMLALNRADSKGDDKRKYIARIAEKTVMKATEGDMMAIKEIGDRLDGKAAQSILGGGDNGEFVHTIKWPLPKTKLDE